MLPGAGLSAALSLPGLQDCSASAYQQQSPASQRSAWAQLTSKHGLVCMAVLLSPPAAPATPSPPLVPLTAAAAAALAMLNPPAGGAPPPPTGASMQPVGPPPPGAWIVLIQPPVGIGRPGVAPFFVLAQPSMGQPYHTATAGRAPLPPGGTLPSPAGLPHAPAPVACHSLGLRGLQPEVQGLQPGLRGLQLEGQGLQPAPWQHVPWVPAPVSPAPDSPLLPQVPTPRSGQVGDWWTPALCLPECGAQAASHAAAAAVAAPSTPAAPAERAATGVWPGLPWAALPNSTLPTQPAAMEDDLFDAMFSLDFDISV